ncbi:MAG: alpha/beta hydrolase [Pseudomonadota bacterium]
MPTRKIAGIETAYLNHTGSAPEALLLHCSLAHQGAWLPLLKALGHPPARTFDLPGHGASGPWDQALGDYSEIATQIAAALCPKPLDVIGHSFGATVALRLAVARPDLVRQLVLIEPVFFAAAKDDPRYQAHKDAFAPFEAAMEAGEAERATQLFTDIWGTGLPWATLPKSQRDYMTQRIHLIPAGASGISADNAGLLRPGKLESLACPVTLIEGEISDPVMGAILDHLEHRMLQVSRHVIAGAGHMAPITHPKDVAEVIGLSND